MTTNILPNQMPFRYFKAQPSAMWAWLIWMVSVLFALFQFFLQLSSGVMVTAFMQSFSIGALGAGFLASSYYYIYTLLQTPAGMMMDRFGVRYLLTGGSFLCGLGCILFAVSPSLWLAVIARLLMGTGAAFAFIGSLHLIREWFAPKRFALMVGLAESIGMAGTVIITISLAILLSRLGWRECMFFSGIIAIGISGLCWLFVYDNPANKIDEASSSLPFSQRLMLVLREPKAWLNGLYNGLMFSVVTVFSALWAIPFLMKESHLSLTVITTACTMVFVGAGIGAPIMGYLSETYNMRRALLMSAGIVTAAIFALIIYLPHLTAPWIFGLMLLLGLSCSSYVLNFAIANEIAPPQAKNTCIGFTNAFCVVTAPILQPLIGAILVHLATIHHHTGVHQYTLHDYRIALGMMPGVMLLASGVAWFL